MFLFQYLSSSRAQSSAGDRVTGFGYVINVAIIFSLDSFPPHCKHCPIFSLKDLSVPVDGSSSKPEQKAD